MDLYSSEKEIIAFFQSIEPEETALIPENRLSEKFFHSIYEHECWGYWIDSSAHNDPPPDFYNDNDHIMMDVMRVDDHGYKNGKGKTVNPTKERESKLWHELKDAGIFETFPNAKSLLIADTKLPTDEDHNYRFYRNNFVDTIEKHKKKIAYYKRNHPGYQIVFFVFDESSMYCSSGKWNKNKVPFVGDIICGAPHLWFADAEFLRVVLHSEIDFLIWFAPYKHADMFDAIGKPVVLPRAAIINVKQYPKDILRKYELQSMVSAEV